MRALRLIGAALTTLRIVDTVKESAPNLELGAAVKSTFTIAVAAGVSYPLADTWQERALLAGAAAGLASMLHDAQWLMRTMADSYVTGIVRAARAGRP